MMAVNQPALPEGHILHEYRLDGMLGVGGFGITYLAMDQNLGQPVAIKEYLPADYAIRHDDKSIHPRSDSDRATFEWGLSRFLDEARTLAAFKHQNIVRVMRFFQSNNTAYMVMEFVRGAALSDWAKTRGPLPQDTISNLILPLADGLRAIHEASYLHRDVKPGNIYIRQDGSPVLLDFGAARSQSGHGEMTAIVSPGFAPLEQYSEDGAQGPWSDLYALGGVMYWLVTGRKPIDATARVRNDPQIPARDAADPRKYSRDFLNAIDWALTPDETRRPQSAQIFMSVLSGISTPVRSVKSDDITRTVPLNAADRQSSQPISKTLDPAQMKSIESQLAERIGPVATVILRNAAKRAATIGALVEIIAPEIEDEDDRTQFLRTVKGNSQPPPSSSGKGALAGESSLAPTNFHAGVLEKAEKRLAQHIGVIARIVVRTAAARARDESELYLILADEIENPEDRKAFIRKAISISRH